MKDQIFYMISYNGERSYFIKTLIGEESLYKEIIERVWDEDYEEMQEIDENYDVFMESTTLQEKKNICKKILKNNNWIKVFPAGENINLELTGGIFPA